jgi:Uri superfamily endonuclease
LKGVYVLVLNNPRDQNLVVGALGLISIEKGKWVYIGSARGTTSTSLEKRIRRHLSPVKKIHWHIDYLLQAECTVEDAIWAETPSNMECAVIKRLLASRKFFSGPSGFGSSDCQAHCISHLLWARTENTMISNILHCMVELELTPHLLHELLDAS